MPETVEPEDGAVMETAGGVVSATVTLTEAVVAILPAASRATAVRMCAPAEASAVFQLVAYGAVVTSAPRLAPSSMNCTPTTPTLSVALAEIVTVPATVAPLAGAVKETAGGVLSLKTVTVTLLDVAVFRAASRATAVKVWAPLLAVVVIQARV